MNPDDQGPERAGEHDPLEQLLKAAAWPEPEPDRLARLHQRWRELSPAPLRRRRPLWKVAAMVTAAGLLAGIVLWQLVFRPSRGAPELAPAVPQKPRPERPLRDVAQGPAEPETPTDAIIPKDPKVVRPPDPADAGRRLMARSRPATLYEQLAFRSLTRRRKPSAGQAHDEVRQADQKLLEDAIARRLSEPDVDLDELTEPLTARRQSHEPLLAERIRRSQGPEQVAAIELLGRLGSVRSVPLLVELSRSPTAHAAAVRGLARLADSDTVGQLAAGEPDPDLQEELLAALIGGGNARSVAVYLPFVARSQTHDAALAALDRVERPPVGLLFEFLASTKRSQRTAAALVLASLNDSQVSERLIQMVVCQGNRQEALLALVASSQHEAFRFVSLARRDPLLLGSVRTVEYRLKTLFP